jgi:hypothetical protein
MARTLLAGSRRTANLGPALLCAWIDSQVAVCLVPRHHFFGYKSSSLLLLLATQGLDRRNVREILKHEASLTTICT